MKSHRRVFAALTKFACRIARLGGWLFIYSAGVASWAADASAFSLEIRVAGGVGGQIAGMPGDVYCVTRCSLQGSGRPILSLFAIPDPGYRFLGWSGACENTLGPLCTLRDGADRYTTAHFAKSDVSSESAKAVLLLHGDGANHSVWNEFVKRRFNDQCPVVYGGVVLGRDSLDTRNNVYCYRMGFGYYDALERIKNRVPPPEKTESTAEVRAYEIRAAVLGILNRHPNLGLMLVAQDKAILAAQSFLMAGSDEQAKVIGLLALQSADRICETTACGSMPVEAAILPWQAEAEQDAEIDAGLRALNESWWTNK